MTDERTEFLSALSAARKKQPVTFTHDGIEYCSICFDNGVIVAVGDDGCSRCRELERSRFEETCDAAYENWREE